jgi:leucyl aminopeptidase (aminopeptidase T)
MRKHLAIAWIVGLAACGAMLWPSNAIAAQQPDLVAIAKRIVISSVHVKSGEVVVIEGGKHTIPLMENIAIEAQKKGAFAQIILDSDRVIRSHALDTPEQYLALEPRYWAEWLKTVDVYITLPPADDIRALDAGVPQSRIATLGKANEFLAALIPSMKFREIDITYPTLARGVSFGIDGPTYVNMVFGAMAADADAMSARGNQIKTLLAKAKSIRITTPSGTDLTLEMNGGPALLDTGTISEEAAKSSNFSMRDTALPSGTLTVIPSNATGKVHVHRAMCRFETMRDLTFTFQDGTMQNFRTASGKACWDSIVAGTGGPFGRISWLQIGLNPAWLAHEENGAAYYPGPGAGLITLGIGDNQYLGGSIKTAGNFNFGFPLTNATLLIDGKKVVDSGKFITTEASSSAPH